MSINDILLTRGVEEIIIQKELEKKLKSGKKLRIKHGVDPTSAKLHIGQAVVYHKLREFQELGHKIIFLIGDFTARLGDPSDKLKTRQMRSKKEVMDMAKNYLNQVGKIIDIKKTEVRYNGEWYDKMKLEDFLHVKSNFTHARLIERDMFQERIKKGLDISAQELDYPVLQGYDSVMLKSDLTICGTDQKFNELCGRQLQEAYGQIPQDIITVPILVGLDGKSKMSQSLKNEIGLDDEPNIMYGKVMSIPDEAVLNYYELAARVGGKELEQIKKSFQDPKNRRDIKADLAKEIVTLYHGPEQAVVAEEEFNRIFRDKKAPIDIPEVVVKKATLSDLPQLLFDLKLVQSKSEARRLITQNAVKVDRVVINNPKAVMEYHNDMVIQVGKLRFVKIKIK